MHHSRIGKLFFVDTDHIWDNARILKKITKPFELVVWAWFDCSRSCNETEAWENTVKEGVFFGPHSRSTVHAVRLPISHHVSACFHVTTDPINSFNRFNLSTSTHHTREVNLVTLLSLHLPSCLCVEQRYLFRWVLSVSPAEARSTEREKGEYK